MGHPGIGAEGEEGGGEVAGAAADVEDFCGGVFEDGREGAGGAVPPAAVEAEGEEMVDAVVSGGDGVEEGLDVGGGGGFVGLVGRAGSGGGLGDHSAAPEAVRTMPWAAARSSSAVTSRPMVASPMPTGRMKERVPLRDFLSLAVLATRAAASALKGRRGP